MILIFIPQANINLIQTHMLIIMIFDYIFQHFKISYFYTTRICEKQAMWEMRNLKLII